MTMDVLFWSSSLTSAAAAAASCLAFSSVLGVGGGGAFCAFCYCMGEGGVRWVSGR